MKKLFLSAAILAGVSFASQAQTEKGKFLTGGSIAFETVKSDASGANAAEKLVILPNIGYFVADNISVGTGIGYSYSNTGSASVTGQNEAFVLNPFGRYYTPLGNNFKFFGQLSVPMEFGTVKATDADGKSGSKTGKSTAVGVALSPGFAYFPSSKIGIEFALNGVAYNNFRVEDGDGNKVKGQGYDSFSIGSDFFAPRIGIQFYF